MEAIYRFGPEPERLIEDGCYIVQMRNVVDDPDCSIARALVRPGIIMKLHCLLGTVEHYVILEGAGEVEIGGELPISVAPFGAVD